jgi:hypothetical protein
MDESFTQEFKNIEKERVKHKDNLVDLGKIFAKLNAEEE